MYGVDAEEQGYSESAFHGELLEPVGFFGGEDHEVGSDESLAGPVFYLLDGGVGIEYVFVFVFGVSVF